MLGTNDFGRRLPFVERLAELPSRELSRSPGATSDEIAEIEQRNDLVLPEDLRAALEFSNGFETSYHETDLSLFDAHEMAWASSEPHFRDGLPGMLILGMDGGGSVYYADPQNRLGRGAFAIYLVRMSNLDVPHSIFVAPRFSEAVTAVLDNENLFRRPQLRDVKTSQSIAARLAALPAGTLLRDRGATVAEIAEIERRNGVTLPDDLRETLLFSNGLGIESAGTSLDLYNARDLAWTSSAPDYRERLAGMLLLGTDGKGSVYFADPENRLGRGNFAVYLVRMSDLHLQSSRFLGRSFSDAVETILAGTDLYKLPELRQGPGVLIARLAALPQSTVRRGDGATAADIAEVEAQNRITLPDDLRETLQFSDGIGVRAGGTQLFLYNAHDLAWTSSEPGYRDSLAGMLILGTDGEGSVYYADPRNAIGRGAFAVYLVRMADLEIESSIFVGGSFTAAVETILAGTDLYKRPELRDE